MLDAAGVGHVRAAAQVDERTIGVDGDDFVLAQLGEALELERIIGEDFLRFGARDLLPLEGKLLGGDALHLLLEVGEVVGRERLRDLEVVVEAVVDRRAEADLGVGAKAPDRGREHMRRRVAQHRQRGGVFFREHAKAAALAQRSVQVLDFPIQLDGHRGLEQPLADRSNHVGGQGSRGNGTLRTVRQRES